MHIKLSKISERERELTETDLFTALGWQTETEHTDERDEHTGDDQIEHEVESAPAYLDLEHDERVDLVGTAFVGERLGIRANTFHFLHDFDNK